VVLKILNRGVRLLRGQIEIKSSGWLKTPMGTAPVPINTGKTQQVQLLIDTQGLAAGQTYHGQLTLVTNGGAVEVPVVMKLAAYPFPHPPLQGAVNPRDLASRMRDHPKLVEPLFESGEIQRWFQRNGWVYPVHGASVAGVARVQQFFEGLGLSKPPKVLLSHDELILKCHTNQAVKAEITMLTAARKWIYGKVDSDSAWLSVECESIAGAQQARIGITANARGLDDNRRHVGRLTVTGNGGQKLTLVCKLEVHRRLTPLLNKLLRPILIGVLVGFLLRFFISLPDPLIHALEARATQSDPALPARNFGNWLLAVEGATSNAGYYVTYFTLLTGWLGGLAGMWVGRRSEKSSDFVPAVVVGTASGFAASATLASVLMTLDRLMWVALPVVGMPFAAILGWAVWGGALALGLEFLGKRGRGMVSWCGSWLTWSFQRVGLAELAEFLDG
jgi:hypothetical protein